MRPLLVTATIALFIAGCGGSDDTDVTESTSDVVTTEDVADGAPIESEPPTEPVSSEPLELEQSTEALLVDPFAIVEQLAGDEFNGRNNLTDGSTAARELLVSNLAGVLEPARPDVAGDEGYLQPYDVGTNIVGILPGRGALADEFVLIGAHYDHLGPGECRTLGEADDDICNGAADNAAGVGAVVSIINMINYADLQAPVQDVSDRSAVRAGRTGSTVDRGRPVGRRGGWTGRLAGLRRRPVRPPGTDRCLRQLRHPGCPAHPVAGERRPSSSGPRPVATS